MITDFKKYNHLKRSLHLLFAVTALLFTSCGSEPGYVEEKNLTELEKEEMLRDAVRKFSDGGDHHIVLDSLSLLSSEEIHHFYEKRDYRPFWISVNDTNSLGALMIGVLDSAWTYGLDPSWYYLGHVKELLSAASADENYVTKSEALAKTDIFLTNAFFLHTTFLAEGFIDTARMGVAWKKDSLKINLSDYLGTCSDSNLVKNIFAFEPHNIEYRRLRSALSAWWRSVDMYTDRFEIPDPKKDSTGFWVAAKQSLQKFGYLDSSAALVDSLAVNALKKFQEFHRMDVDGKPGRQSAWALGLSNYDRFLRAALAMEKWRWKQRDSLAFQFRINIPSYELNVLRNDSLIYIARVVTGATDHQTPELRATVRYFTLFPYWNVPHSISTEEILPYVKRDTNYMHKHHYRIFDLKKNEVSISAVNWKKLSKDYFPY
ncbi:MAG: L,D-transpeptidase family protein, partial [Flavobacteriales bacterium]|nr:L,D-transpeptidase family protein [Flavobacteriales bacterium]